MNPYEDAIKVWIARKSGSPDCGFWAEDIREIQFGNEQGGYCETCWYEYPAIRFSTERNGKIEWHDISIEGMDFAQVIKECLETYKTLTSFKPYEFE